MSGRYPPGHLLSGEISSSEKLAVSRTAYREAVRILAAKGLLDARPKVGTRVNPRAMWHLLDPDVLDWAFETSPDLKLLDSLFELRNVVESAAAGFAAQRRSASQLRVMATALKDMEHHTLATDAGRQADVDFHTTLLLATNNPFIISLADGVKAAIRTTTIYKQKHQPVRRDPLPDHLRVLDAISAKDPDKARSAMSDLIQLARIDTPTGRRGPRKG